jgi:molybdopterin/thiamine biosynthesis adenylyltransferase
VTQLNEEQRERFKRHILLPGVGEEGQGKLLKASVLVVGAGGLGSPALIYLAASGVGHVTVADGDTVELSNLHRQIIHPDRDAGRRKVDSAEDHLRSLNPECRVETIPEPLRAANIRQVLKGFDVALDCSDNFPTRFLVADCCRFEEIPLVSAAVLHFEGQLMTLLPGPGNPCYRCFLPEPPPSAMLPNSGEMGILGAVAGVMGVLQAMEALKLLLGIGDVLSHHLIVYDGLESSFHKIDRLANPDCPLCGSSPTITDLVDYDASDESA